MIIYLSRLDPDADVFYQIQIQPKGLDLPGSGSVTLLERKKIVTFKVDETLTLISNA